MSKVKVVLQLFSKRDYMEKDMDAALKKVKVLGYDYVELAGYFGKSAEEIRAILDKYDLKCISVHQGLDFYDEKGVEGAEFVKTSTGFSTGGATTEDIRLMRETVGPEMGVKASGGVKSFEAACAMIEAGASRIGTSSSSNICE